MEKIIRCNTGERKRIYFRKTENNIINRRRCTNINENISESKKQTLNRRRSEGSKI